MKVVVIASLAPPATANYLVSALKQNGHQLLVCSDLASSLTDMLVYGAVDVAELCCRQKFSPDLCLFVEGGTMQLFPVGLEGLQCITAWYGIDTHMDYNKHLLIGRLFDVTFVAQKEYISQFLSDGLKQVFWLPLAFAPALHPSSDVERNYTVSYVGSNDAMMHPKRHQLINLIREKFPRVFFGRAIPEEMGRIYAQSLIVFNKSVSNDLNMRYFEAMGAGAVLLTDQLEGGNGVEDLFIAGEHFLFYKDSMDLLRTIENLLVEPSRIQKIGQAARKCILEAHTYEHRVESMLQQLAGCTKMTSFKESDYFASLVSLGLLKGAVQSVAKVMLRIKGGRCRLLVAQMSFCIFQSVAVILGFLEWLQRAISNFKKGTAGS